MKGIVIFLAATLVVNCEDKDKETKNYLKQYGFIIENAYGGGNVTDGIKLFQRTYGLKVTGVVDKETEKLMHTDRCGVKDFGGDTSNSNYASNKWEKEYLTYSFKSYTPDLRRRTIERLTAKALNIWGNVTNLHFSKQKKGGDIKFAFARRRHGTCPHPFDGRGGVLAHAYFPHTYLRGQVDFDDDEYFTTKQSRGVNYLWVATHELGHTLGLDHDTSTKNAVMYPFIRSYSYHKGNIKLHYNDKLRIQNLYGTPRVGTRAPVITKGRSPPVTTKVVTSAPTVPEKKSTPAPRLVCRDRVGSCSWFRKQCGLHRSYLLKLCPHTCGFCTPNAEGCFKGCQNYSTRCGKHLTKCRDYTPGWTRWSKKFCALACEYCCRS